MSRKVIGLDIGAASIKAVEIETHYKRFEITACYEAPRRHFDPPPEAPTDEPEKQNEKNGSARKRREAEKVAPPPAFIKDLTEFIERFNLSGADVIATLPSEKVFIRQLELPFSDKKKISELLPHQLRAKLPLGSKELLIDFIISPNGSGSTGVMAGAAETIVIGERLEHFSKAGVDPKELDAPANSLANLIRNTSGELEKICLLEIGSSHTSIVYIDRSKVKSVRTFKLGGAELTRRLASAIGISEEEAEQFKRENIIFGPTCSPELNKSAVEAAESWISDIIREMRLTLHKYSTDAEVGNIKLLMCGGGSLAGGLSSEIGARMGLASSLLNPFSDRAEMTFTAPEGAGRFAGALGLALKDVWGPRGLSFNFRSGPFLFRRSTTDLRNKLIYAGSMLVLILGVASLSFFSGYFSKRSEIDRLNANIMDIYKELLPNTPPMDPVEQIRNLFQKVEISSDPLENSIAFIDIFRGMSKKAPPTVSVKYRELVFDQDSLKIRGQTTSYESVDQIKTVLEGLKWVKTVEVKETRGCGPKTESCIKFLISAELGKKAVAEDDDDAGSEDGPADSPTAGTPQEEPGPNGPLGIFGDENDEEAAEEMDDPEEDSSPGDDTETSRPQMPRYDTPSGPTRPRPTRPRAPLRPPPRAIKSPNQMMNRKETAAEIERRMKALDLDRSANDPDEDEGDRGPGGINNGVQRKPPFLPRQMPDRPFREDDPYDIMPEEEFEEE